MTNTLYTIGPLIKVSREGNPAGPLPAPQASVQAQCDLQASFVRNGSIVAVELDFVRAHFTIESEGGGLGRCRTGR